MRVGLHEAYFTPAFGPETREGYSIVVGEPLGGEQMSHKGRGSNLHFIYSGSSGSALACPLTLLPTAFTASSRGGGKGSIHPPSLFSSPMRLLPFSGD